MARKPFIAANWKMNKTISETKEFFNGFIPLVKNMTDVDIVIAPPFTSLAVALERMFSTKKKARSQAKCRQLWSKIQDVHVRS
jgi:triosephosphate isomerase